MFNIDIFRANVNARGGYQPANKHQVIFNSPIGLVDQDSQEVSKEMSFWIKTAPIPGVKLKMHPTYRYGYGVLENKPVSPVFSFIELVVNSDAEGKNLAFFNNWMSLICPFDMSKGMSMDSGNYDVAYKDTYAVQMTIVTYNNSGKEVQRTVLREAHPVSVPDIYHDWGRKDAFIQFPVEICFMDWYSEPINVQ